MRAVKIIRNILAVLGLVWLCMPIFREAKKVVALSFPWVWQEKGRVPTPSGACEVVTYEGNRGGMSSFAHVCFLVKPGGKVDPNAVDFYEPILATSHAHPKPRWENDNRLIISCEGGYVGHQRPYSRDFKVAIEVRGAEMSRYQVSLCEHATGIVRDADSHYPSKQGYLLRSEWDFGPVDRNVLGRVGVWKEPDEKVWNWDSAVKDK